MTQAIQLQPQIVYLVERAPPPIPEQPNLIDQIKRIVGIALAAVGLLILVGATIALVGYITGKMAISVHSLHSFFIMGTACTVGGFHLAKGGTPTTPYAEITAGPFSVTI